MNLEERVTDLELRFMAQQELLEELDRQMVALNRVIASLETRVQRIETQTDVLVRKVFPPQNERPPHH